LIHADLTKLRHGETAEDAHDSRAFLCNTEQLGRERDAIVRIENYLDGNKGMPRKRGRLYRGHPRKPWPYIELSKSHHRRRAEQNTASKGLTSDEARTRLQKDGPNAMPDVSLIHCGMRWSSSGRRPWLLEASIVLQVVLHKYARLRHCGLLVFNAALAYFRRPRPST